MWVLIGSKVLMLDGIVLPGCNIFEIACQPNYWDASFNLALLLLKKMRGLNRITMHKVSSLFSRVNYDYMEKYLFTGIMRRDGSRFGTKQ